MDRMFTVFIVDDDAGVLKGLSRLLRAQGYDIRPYASPRDFLAVHDGRFRLRRVRCSMPPRRS